MPHINQKLRDQLDKLGVPPMVAGELNYRFSTEIIRYIKNQGLRYQTINDVMGALVGALLEFYFEVAKPYENLKIKENGNVYEEIISRAAGGSGPSGFPGSLRQEPGRSFESGAPGDGTSGNSMGS